MAAATGMEFDDRPKQGNISHFVFVVTDMDMQLSSLPLDTSWGTLVKAIF